MAYRHLLLCASILLNLLLLWALVWGDDGVVAYRALKNELAELSGRADILAEKNLQLSREIKLLESDKKYIEQMIRKRLNFIKENEIWYVFPEQGGTEGANETKN